MKYSISEAARIVGVTRKTLYKHIEKKPISTEKDDNDRPVIDASELMRVYGDQCNFDRAKAGLAAKEEGTAKEMRQESTEYRGLQYVPKAQEGREATPEVKKAARKYLEGVIDGHGTELAVTLKELEITQKQLAAERETYEEQIDYLRTKLDESNSETRKLTALITDQSQKDTKKNDWENSIQALERRLANQERVVERQIAHTQSLMKKNRELKEALENAEKRSFADILLGRVGRKKRA